jgi:hypothetical protein
VGNHGEAVFDPWPRLLSRPMIWNDALRVGRDGGRESEQGPPLGPVITSGRPLTPALAEAGFRYVIVDAGPLLGLGRAHRDALPRLARLPGAQVVLASPDLVVFRLPA